MEKWDDLVNLIVDNVLNKIERDKPRNEHVVGTLALITTYVPSPKTAGDTLVSFYGEDIECAMIGEACFDQFGLPSFEVQDRQDESLLVKKAASKGCIVLVTPKINLLQRIAQGEDDGFVEHIVLRSLLWGRNVVILLDFPAPKFKRGTFFEKICDIIDSLTSMGIRIAQYQCSKEADVNVLSLVTELEVEQAVKEGKRRILCSPQAIVTPLAKERAAALGVAIER